MVGGDSALPPLREDLRLIEAAAGRSGEPAWVIQDNVRNRFFRIGWLEFECLLRWGASAREICAQIIAQTTLRPDVEQIEAFRRFLEYNQLLRAAPGGLPEQSSRWLDSRWWLHHYLFFRIPLFRPQRALGWLARHLDWLFTRTAALVVAALCLLGIVLVAHQWDTFRSAVVESFSTSGLLSFAVALFVAKTIHEMSHAIVATRLGVRVAHMGVAFVVLWPMLYTDTGESWKLRDARQRLAIASAGVLSEILLAGLATLGWALTDPGFLRNALLYLATTSWALSLALNASPFMRFDGYFVVSDLLDFPNLHERSFAMARVWMRNTVLGLDEAWPEPASDRRRRVLIAFALFTWMYRLVLFAGIAVAVYLLFFKALGIMLFAVEVGWFIAAPMLRELRYWWARRSLVRPRRRMLLLAGLSLIVLLLAIPWRTEVEGDGVARSQDQLRVFAPYAARILSIARPGAVEAGQTLASFEAPEVTARVTSSEAAQRGYEARLGGLIADEHSGRDESAATEQRLGVEQQEASAARSEIRRLTLRAPFAGQWRDVDRELQPGQWLGTRDAVGVLIDPTHWQVDGYVDPDELHWIRTGAAARFFPVGSTTALHGRVIEVSSAGARQLAHPMLSQTRGGPIKTARDDALLPSPPRVHVLVQLDSPVPARAQVRGELHIEGERRSLLADGARHLIEVLVRESGF